MGNLNFGYSSLCGKETLNDVPWVQYGRNGKVIASGRMSKKDVLPSLQKNELLAYNTMKRTNAAHVLYGLKIYDKNDDLEMVQFYNWEMDEEKFQRCATKCRNGIVYALHRR